MSFLTALTAGVAGQAEGKVAGYKDALARQADLERLHEQQRQFDEAQKLRAVEDSESTREFNLQNARAQAVADREASSWRKPDPKHGDKYGGYNYQRSQQELKSGQQGLRSGDAQIQGQLLTNAGKQIANQFEPILAQLDIQSRTIANRNAADNSPSAQFAREQQMAQLRQQLDLGTYKMERGYDVYLQQTAGSDPQKISAQYVNALKGVDAGRKELTAVDKATGQPLIPQQVRDAIAYAEQLIASSSDPLGMANQLVASPKDEAKTIRTAGFTGHIYQVAVAEYLRRKMTGANTQQPAAPTQAQGTPYPYTSWAPGPFGQALGGSQGTSPFTRP